MEQFTSTVASSIFLRITAFFSCFLLGLAGFSLGRIAKLQWTVNSYNTRHGTYYGGTRPKALIVPKSFQWSLNTKNYSTYLSIRIKLVQDDEVHRYLVVEGQLAGAKVEVRS